MCWLRIGAIWLVAVALFLPGVAASKPEWVERSGLSRDFPRARFATGYGIASGKSALTRAKQEAAADLARKLSVRIESEFSDVSQERAGEYSYKLAAVTRSTTDVQLSGLHYAEPYKRWGRVHVLVWVDRADAARARRVDRDRALEEVRACLAAGEAATRVGRKKIALETFEDCRRPVAEALHHQAVSRALLPGDEQEAGGITLLIGISRRLDAEIEAILTAPSQDLSRATDAMALQLARQGVSTRSRMVVSHWNYGATNLSSSFGRQAGLELERALARAARDMGGAVRPLAAPDLAISGVYFESGDQLRMSATAREVASGRLVASAEARMPTAAVSEHLELRPRNFASALRDQKILSAGALAQGDLRVEVWTDKGRGGVLYSEHEKLRLFMRVNQPSWVRLLYVLQSGDQVPIDQSFRIGRNQVNRVVEYPQSFEVVKPFGIEMIHAMAFVEKPPRLSTRERMIAGVRYDVVEEGLDAILRTRGLARRDHTPIAEATVTVTTTPPAKP